MFQSLLPALAATIVFVAYAIWAMRPHPPHHHR
jgi:hypothetical protein